jgi:hypothetical protein
VLALTATIVGVVGVAPALATWTPGAPSSPGNVTPTVVGDGKCSAVGSSGTQFKVNKLYVDGTYVISGGPTITIDASADKKSFSWTISPGFQVNDVTVLGVVTPFNHYDYGETPRDSDGNLHAPLIGTTSTLLWFGYFCWSAVEAPPVDGSITGTKYNDTNASGGLDGGDVPLIGWAIHLIGPGDHESPIFTDESGSYAFEGLEAGTYTVCEAAGDAESGWQQSGPLGPENDVCQGEGFPAGLAAGGYQVVLEEGATVDGRDFFNFAGVSLDCGDDTFVGGEGDTATGSFTRVDNEGCDEGDVKGVLTDVENVEGEEIIVFIPHGFGDSNYSGTLTFFKDSGDPDLLVLQYDPGDGFREMPACGDADIVEGQVISASIPDGDNWCFASVVAEPVGEGQWQVNWLVFGLDDPRFK